MDNPDEQKQKVEVRDPRTGQFAPGNSIGGRTKGSRNEITKLRLEVEEASRLYLQSESHAILSKAVEMAKLGNEKMLAVLLDKMLTTPKDDPDADKKPEAVKVIVVTQPSAQAPKITVMKQGDRPVIDVTPTPVD